MLGKRGSMMLFFRGLPENLTCKELKVFIQGAVNGADKRYLTKKAAVSNCTILRITDQSNGCTEHHGLVEVQPPKAAMRAIEALNAREIKGARVEVRRYQHRSPLRDQRRKGAKIAAEQAEERQKERRRRHLKIDLVGT
jgi:hypothetical protein